MIKQASQETSKGRTHWSHKEIIDDCLVALRARLSIKSKKALFKTFYWAWTTINGKHSLSIPHTTEAEKILKQSKRIPKKGLRHEHCVPMRVLSNTLIKEQEKILSSRNPHRILEKFFRRNVQGVLITVKEDKQLNKRYRDKLPSFEECIPINKQIDIYERYKVLGLKLVFPK